MRGGLRERSPGVWEVRVERGRDPVTGRRLQISRTVRGGKREAQRKLNALLAEVDEGTTSSSDAKFRDVAERWLRLTKADLSPTTFRRYRGLLEHHIYPALGNRAAASIRTSELDELYLGLIERKNLSAASVRQVHAVIRRALQQAVRWGWIRTNPATDTTPPRVPPSTISPPEVGQVLALLAAADTAYPEFGRFLRVAVTSGARRGELCALRWRNVDWDNATLTIARAVVEVEGGLFEKDTKTHAVRRIALDGATVDVLRTHHAAANATAAAAEIELPVNAFVFTHDPAGGRPWTPDHVTKAFQRFRRKVGADAVRLHDLRHFAATQLLAAGVPVRTVSGRLGHANAATTLGVYAHFVEQSDRDAANALSHLLADPT